MSRRDFSRQSVRRQLSGEGLRPKKSLGQNFLTDDGVLLDIVNSACLKEDSCVLEIGPGMGVLTRELAERAGCVTAVEIDRTILPVLEKNLQEYSHVNIVNGDILKVNLLELFKTYFGAKPVQVVANLPYYITTPIIMKLLETDIAISSVVLMIQREVARRLAAESGSRDFGAISLAVQYRAEVQHVRDVSPEAFEPMPKVWSSVVRLVPREKPPVSVLDETHFFHLIKSAFSQRRKTFINAVSSDGSIGIDKEGLKAVLTSLGLDANLRGETLGLNEFAQISNAIVRKKC
ncbi:MAG: 16S rRNA (adenine(1518)-N(6)/adenine(1519)-N(6))-dimethyltransferase RsmA [Ruminococcaceae bacterium]|nr:16S rRNA (adenine(1518)-N(6)/adenine(1519)-N(6))-dimethyltransferase RsmA [Oscillospiraceae bacterium]